MQRRESRRRRRVINSPFQYRTVAIYLTVVLAGFVVFSAGLCLYYWLSYARGDNHVPQIVSLVLPPLLINNLVIMVFVVIVGIATSLRAAGPVFRVQDDIDRALSGERGVRVKVRRDDSFPELAEKVNQLLERLDAGGARR